MRLRIPTAYHAVTLGQYIDWHDSLDDVERMTAVTGLTREAIEQLSPAAIKSVVDAFAKVLEADSGIHTRIVKIGRVKYGFIPSLDELTFKEFADLTKLAELCFGDKPRHDLLPLLMAVLYRPITMKIGDRYRIEDYDSDKAQERAPQFRAMSMEVVGGAMLFFSAISNEYAAGGLQSLERQRMNLMRKMKETMQQLDNELQTQP